MRAEVVDAAPAPSVTPPPTPPFRAIPSGEWWSEDRARIQLRISGTRATLSEHLETERAPLIAEGPYESTMERDGSFTVVLTVNTLEKKFLSRCLDCKSKDVHETPSVATLDGEEVTRGGVVRMTIKFSEDDRVAEMCLTSSKKCERLKRG